MDCLLSKIDEYFCMVQWILAAAGLLITYMVVNEVVKIFTNINEEMWRQ
jgi:hypothetical protein